MPFASKAAAQGDWWRTFRPSLPERSDNSETFVLSLDERLLNVSLARSARSSGVVLGNSINNSPILRCALFLISELYPRPPCFWPAARRLPTRGLCPAVLSPHRRGGIRQSLYTWRHFGWGRVVVLVLALRLVCLKRSSDSRRPLLKALLNKSQSLSGNERARVGMALAAQVVVLPFDDTEAPRVNVFLIRDVVVHQEVMFTEPVK